MFRQRTRYLFVYDWDHVILKGSRAAPKYISDRLAAKVHRHAKAMLSSLFVVRNYKLTYAADSEAVGARARVGASWKKVKTKLFVLGN